jgi:hypothetical protein
MKKVDWRVTSAILSHLSAAAHSGLPIRTLKFTDVYLGPLGEELLRPLCEGAASTLTHVSLHKCFQGMFSKGENTRFQSVLDALIPVANLRGFHTNIRVAELSLTSAQGAVLSRAFRNLQRICISGWATQGRISVGDWRDPRSFLGVLSSLPALTSLWLDMAPSDEDMDVERRHSAKDDTVAGDSPFPSLTELRLSGISDVACREVQHFAVAVPELPHVAVRLHSSFLQREDEMESFEDPLIFTIHSFPSLSSLQFHGDHCKISYDGSHATSGISDLQRLTDLVSLDLAVPFCSAFFSGLAGAISVFTKLTFLSIRCEHGDLIDGEASRGGAG